VSPLRLNIDSDLKGRALAYADRYGISLADAVRILLRKGLDTEAEVAA
jgi:antitoxin component of RelBE/YafQ-DinJ toxin-antitoxin module